MSQETKPTGTKDEKPKIDKGTAAAIDKTKQDAAATNQTIKK